MNATILLCPLYNNVSLRTSWLLCVQLTQALKEIEDLKQQLISSKENWEYEKLRLKEDM